VRVLSALLATLAILAPSLGADAATADAISQLRPLDLRVSGGEDVWHADNSFRLDWDRPPVATAGLPVRAVHFRLRDDAGRVVLPASTIVRDVTRIEYIHVPSGPGRYLADVWLESTEGRTGPAVSAVLLFDDARPASARPLAPSGWVAGAAAASLRFEHPAPPLPVSGIRGYAVSVGRGAGSPPCAGPDRCSLAETDVRGGIASDTISLGLLAEGTHVVHAVAVSGAGMRSAQALSTTVRVDATDPEVALHAPGGWLSGPVQVRASAADRLSGMDAAGPSGPYTAIAVDGAPPRTQPGPLALATVAGEGRHRVAVYARDGAGNVADGSPRVALVQIDESPPAVAFARSQDPAEPERIEAGVSDSLSGSDPARGSIGFRPAGSRQRFQPLATTVAAGRLVARWDSDASPSGTYEFRATAYDLAGNYASSDRRANGTRMVLANPLKAPATIEAGFGGRLLVWHRCQREQGQRRCRPESTESFEGRPKTRTVPYGGGVSFSGRLTAARGAALGSLPVEVVETFDPGSRPARRTTTIKTAADGSFQIRLIPGPGRRVEASFGGNHVLTLADADPVRLAVLGGLRFRSSRSSARVGGAPVAFRGRVADLGVPIPEEGRSVELQFRFPGADWSVFRTVQTDRQGRFHYPYAFSDDDSRGVRFQFRAFAPAQEGWPYEPSFSRPVFVTGS
jgi:hypothetical protein